MTVCVVGSNWNDRTSAKARLIQLNNGIHRFRFVIKLDKSELPSSFDSIITNSSGVECRVIVQYNLILRIDSKDQNFLECHTVPINIGGYQFNIEKALDTKPTKEIKIHEGKYGKVKLEAALLRNFYYIGDQVEIDLKIDSELETDIVAIKLEMKNYINIRTMDKKPFILEDSETLALFRDNSIHIKPVSSFKKILTLTVPPSSRPTLHTDIFEIGAYIEVTLIINGSHDSDYKFQIPLILLNLKKITEQETYSDISYESIFDQKETPKVISWVHDSESGYCWVCSCDFNMFLRRHHCRFCGLLVCKNCSPMMSIPPVFGKKEQRVCYKCIPKEKR